MYVQLRFPIECSPEEAWRALRSVAVVREIYAPLLDVRPVSPFIPAEPGASLAAEDVLAPGTMWEPGEVECEIRLLGVIPLGRQIIRVNFERSRDGSADIFVDTGGATAGPLKFLRGWRHRMAVAPDPADPTRTLWRDRVEFHGPAAPVFWFLLWSLWQVRGASIRRLAPGWSESVRS
ncbi:hypothetical protein [Mycetocola spongiae]|uniref:hypothetical protein n=1 Tax=Mycetocola spongiae TaxID=2859226 RepID=UPI001CF34F72|nr:hypothetical protein [Mycetocola spongiae]UCR88534.1 hypothetical protein KXZ72_11280 [Mycetocola spongiae]